ncbi:DNA replication/repair protein RecF [Compostibacter hankyongensis]|uniref:DNA replication and repair protein RecF n=1 Tax=Compostibacter hankyongensis TaxID=1007089 RepID=A0ABP8FK29_9BACT
MPDSRLIPTLPPLFLSRLSLTQFKNYGQRQYAFHRKITGITGPNGAGKTNLLDAIYYLSFTKSYFSGNDTQNIKYQTDGFRIQGVFSRQETSEEVSCVLKGGKKTVALNEAPYTRFSEHVGSFPAVMIAPDDAVIIQGGSEERRRFLDSLLCQLHPDYLRHLIDYNKILQQRNSLLRACAEKQTAPGLLLDTLDEQLAAEGQPVFHFRASFLRDFSDQVQSCYDYLSGSGETVSIGYESDLSQAGFPDLLRSNRQRDQLLLRTSAGIHRDDLRFRLNGHALKSSASQGQRKSFLFALKLAQYAALRIHKQLPPLLLLDDLFEKLDEQRMQRLISMVTGPEFGQVFITDTHAGRLEEAFKDHKDLFQQIDVAAEKQAG